MQFSNRIKGQACLKFCFVKIHCAQHRKIGVTKEMYSLNAAILQRSNEWGSIYQVMISIRK
jgi:hypothetical protein